MTKAIRNLVLVLGDQLDPDGAALHDFDPQSDRVWMAEVAEESRHVWSHKARIALFLTAMRHFRQQLDHAGWPLTYHQMGEHCHSSLSAALTTDIERLRPQRIVLA